MTVSKTEAYAATEFKLVESEDAEWTVRYDLPGVGGFGTNLYEGTEGDYCILAFDSNVVYKLFLNDVEIKYNSNDVIMDAGDYTVYIADEKEDMFGYMHFTVVNSFGDYLEDLQFASLIKDPEMKINYDSDSGMLAYAFPNGEQYLVSVPSGALSKDNVKIELSSNMTATVSFNDTILTGIDEYVFSEVGTYAVNIVCYSADFNSADVNTYSGTYYFTIIGSTISNINILNAPVGYQIANLSCDGNELQSKSEKAYALRKDGIYECTFASIEDESIQYQITFVRDTTAPFLTFAKELEDTVEVPLTFYRSEPNAKVVIRTDGIDTIAVTDTIKTSGYYNITVSDEAGNSRMYHVQLERTYKLVNIKTIVLFVVLLAGLGLYLIKTRKNMQIL